MDLDGSVMVSVSIRQLLRCNDRTPALLAKDTKIGRHPAPGGGII